MSFSIDDQGYAIPAYPKENDDNKNVLSEIFTDEPNWDKTISSSGSSLNWEARLSVVQKYTDIVNSHTRRKKEFELKELIKHWREKLLLPIELATDLKPKEYAALVEGIDANSPIEVHVEAIRYYPFKEMASHVLGYVGSGYEANPVGMSGSDLATFEIKGRKGKAGLEKVYDEHLRESTEGKFGG